MAENKDFSSQDIPIKNLKKNSITAKTNFTVPPPRMKSNKNNPSTIINMSMSRTKNTTSSKEVTLKENLSSYPKKICSSELSNRKNNFSKPQDSQDDQAISRIKDKSMNPITAQTLLPKITTIREKVPIRT